MTPAIIEYGTEQKSPVPDSVKYESEYQPEPWRTYGAAAPGTVFVEFEAALQFVFSPPILPGFGMWSDRAETDEELLKDLGGDWSGFGAE